MKITLPGTLPVRTSLAFIGMAWVLPFLYHRHPYPIATFYQEWGAILLGLCAMYLLATKDFWRRPDIPRIAALPFGLALIILLQAVAGEVAYWGQALVGILFLLWSMLLMALGQHLRITLGLPFLITVLSIFLLAGAELSAMAGVVQHFSLHSTLSDLLVDKLESGERLSGNLGQPNQFASYTTMGLVSLGLLYASGKMRIWQVVIFSIPLLFVLALSGSRSPWLYILFLLGLAFIWQWSDKAKRPLLYFCLALLLGFSLMNFAVQIPWREVTEAAIHESGMQTRATALERMADGLGAQGSIRLYIWSVAWITFTHFPLSGAGFGQFSWQYFDFISKFHETNAITGVGAIEHSHNLVLQIAAEMGLAGMAILFGAVWFWIWRVSSAARSIYHWWAFCLLGILGIHSMLEYPLWYAFFLGMAALLFGMLDEKCYRINLPRAGRALFVSMLLFGAAVMPLILADHRKLEDLYLRINDLTNRAENDYRKTAQIQQVRHELILLQGKMLLLRPYLDYALAKTGWDHLDGMTPNPQLLRFIPDKVVAYREAILLEQAGHHDDACKLIAQAIWAHPEGFQEIIWSLRRLANENPYPARFPELLEFAAGKYKERQSAFKNN